MQVRDEFHTQLRGRISESLIDERELIGQMYVNAELPYYKQYTPDELRRARRGRASTCTSTSTAPTTTRSPLRRTSRISSQARSPGPRHPQPDVPLRRRGGRFRARPL
ncbi:MAG: hypothetical protein ACLVL7_09460 [Anaerotruncus massiliensis (ex Togo et al. 2019)]